MTYRGSSNAQQVPFDIFISSAVKRLALTGIDLNEDLYQGCRFYRKHNQRDQKEIAKRPESNQLQNAFIGNLQFYQSRKLTQEKQQEVKFTSGPKKRGQAKTKPHHTIRHELQLAIILRIFHGVGEKSVKDSILKPTDVAQMSTEGLKETFTMDFKIEYFKSCVWGEFLRAEVKMNQQGDMTFIWF